MPVFSPTGPGGIAQLLGPTGGFLMVYPFVAFLAGYMFEHGRKHFARAALAGFWRDSAFCRRPDLACPHAFAGAGPFSGLYWFLFAEVIKVMFAAGIAARWQRQFGGIAVTEAQLAGGLEFKR